MASPTFDFNSYNIHFKWCKVFQIAIAANLSFSLLLPAHTPGIDPKLLAWHSSYEYFAIIATEL